MVPTAKKKSYIFFNEFFFIISFVSVCLNDWVFVFVFVFVCFVLFCFVLFLFVFDSFGLFVFFPNGRWCLSCPMSLRNFNLDKSTLFSGKTKLGVKFLVIVNNIFVWKKTYHRITNKRDLEMTWCHYVFEIMCLTLMVWGLICFLSYTT